MRSPTPSPENKKVSDILLRQGLLTAEQIGAALRHAAEEATRVEESVLELGLATEADMLKALAAAYKTRFVST
jgi:hypothetical protein